MAATIGGISVFIEDDSARFTQSMQRNAALVEQQSQRMERALGGTAKSVDELGRKASSFQPDAFRSLSLSALRANSSVERLQKTILALTALGGGGLGGALAAKTLTDTADRYTLIQNRIASIIPLQKDRAAAEEQIFQIAQSTRSSFESTAQLYQRLNLGAKALGASQAEVAEVTKTVQQALQTGGATTSEAASAAVQLSQALASGTLNGDELRSVLENSEVLSTAIAQEFGVTSDKLKEMGQNGELAASRVFRALLKAGPAINDQFERSIPTFGQSLQVLDNAFTKYIGQTDKALGVTNAMAQGIIALANNMQTLGNAAVIAAIPLAAIAANRLGQRIGSATGAPVRAEYARRTEAQDEAESARNAAREALGRTEQVLQETQQRAKVDPRSFVESQILSTRETLRKELERENAAVLAAEQKYQAALKAAAQQPGAVATGGAALTPQRQALRESQDELRRAERAAAQAASNDAPVRLQERLNASVAKEAEPRKWPWRRLWLPTSASLRPKQESRRPSAGLLALPRHGPTMRRSAASLRRRLGLTLRADVRKAPGRRSGRRNRLSSMLGPPMPRKPWMTPRGPRKRRPMRWERLRRLLPSGRGRGRSGPRRLLRRPTVFGRVSKASSSFWEVPLARG
jgi:tape measure domain-containing protein